MKILLNGTLLAAMCLLMAATNAGSLSPASPLYGVSIPEGYRQWPLIAPSIEAEPLNELRVILGNTVALAAYRNGTRPFPDGAILVKMAWKEAPSPHFPSATVSGDATNMQIMVKDSMEYAASGGWGYGRFVNGKPADEAQHQTCFACHDGRVRSSDYVFTRIAP